MTLDTLVKFYFLFLVIDPLSFAVLGLLGVFDHKPRAYRKSRARKFKRA